MLKNIIAEISQALLKHGAERVYSAFDSLPVSCKGREIFNIVGIESCESSAPIYSQYTVFIPFKAEAAVSVAAPEDCAAEKLYEYFDEHILPAFEEVSSLTCKLKRLTVRTDRNINRLVLRADFSVSGISRLERSGV